MPRLRPLRTPLLLLTVLGIGSMPLSTDASEVIRVASISDEPSEEIETFLPLARYLGARLQEIGVRKGKVVIARTIPEMAELLRAGDVDLYIDSPFPALAVKHLAGSEVSLRRWKKGVDEYSSVIVTPQKGGAAALAELNGRMIAFEDPYSSAGYMLPKLNLMDAGFKLTRKSSPRASVAEDEVGYVFARDDETTLLWVERGLVDAGALGKPDFLGQPDANRGHFAILHETETIPRHLVSFRSDLEREHIEHIEGLLLGMDASAEGRSALLEFEKTLRFDRIPADSLETLQRAQDFVRDEFKEQ